MKLLILSASMLLAVTGASATSSVIGQGTAPQSQPVQSSSAPKAGDQPSGSEKTPEEGKSQQEKAIEKKEESQRVLGVVPEFGVTNRMNAPPLSSAEKFHLFFKSAFDPATLGIVGLQAAISQGEDEFPEYGQGAEGFGKRYGASLADEVSSGFFSNYVYPTLLRQDPRYFRLGQGSPRHRIFYSVKQEFVAHTDSGGRQFNFSNVLGAFTSGGVSNIYYPQSDRGFGLTMSRSAIAIAYGVLGGAFDEFWPDIHGKIFHKH